MRVLVTGMGGELGTRVVRLLESDASVSEIHGIDGYPPRRRTTRTTFHRIDPEDRRTTVHLLRELDPEVVLHLGVYEPCAHLAPVRARLATRAAAVSALEAAARCPSLRRVVVRSALDVYGRRRGSPTRPDETAPLDPTTAWGRSLAHVESVAGEAADAAGAALAVVRFAPIVGPSFPSPLGRYLRLPVVAVDPWSELPFSVVHQEDAAHALVQAGLGSFTGPVNVAGPGAVTPSQAVRRGRRLPVAVCGPGWGVAAATSGLLGAPVPDHVREVLTRGRVADCGRSAEVLEGRPRPTEDVVDDLYRWSEVARPDVAAVDAP